MKKLAPIVLFVYNRLAETQQTIWSLQKNHLSSESDLFIFSDGPKDEKGKQNVEKVRAFIKTISGFKKVIIKESPVNRGLAKSVIGGVTEIINEYGVVIAMEDDLVTSPNFLDFMNQALDFYSESMEVISISGYTLDLASLEKSNFDYYVGYRASSLGWGTWENRWNPVDWGVSDYQKFRKDFSQQYKFSKISSDLPGMLKKQMNGKIDSWAIRWCYHQFKNNLLTIYASKSKINHIGLGEDATHCVDVDKFNTPLDASDRRVFEFDHKLHINKEIIKQFRSIWSIRRRSIDKFNRIFKNMKEELKF